MHIQTRSSLLIILLLGSFFIDCSSAVSAATNNAAEIVSITPNRSCASFQTQGQGPSLNCGSVPNPTATVLSLALPLGTNQSFTYEFEALMPSTPVINTNGAGILNEAQCDFLAPSAVEGGPSICLKAERIKITFRVSKVLQAFGLQLVTGPLIPHAYSAHFSPTFRKVYQTSLDQCGQHTSYLAHAADPDNAEETGDTFQSILRLVNVDSIDKVPTNKANIFNTPPFAYNGRADADTDDGPWSGNYDNVDGGFFDYASPERNFECSMCSMWNHNYMSNNINAYYDSDPTHSTGTDNREILDCPWTTGRNDITYDGIIEAVAGFLPAPVFNARACDHTEVGIQPTLPNALNATYCGSACRDKYGQVVRPNFPARQWAGSLSVQGPIWKCQTQGGGVNSGDTGVNKTCFEECRATPGCYPYPQCITGVPPLHDACGSANVNANFQKLSTPGPEILYWYNPVFIGCSELMGIWPNAGGKSPNPNSPTRTPPADGSACTVDDDDCASVYNPTAASNQQPQSTNTLDVNIVECMPCGCIANYGETHKFVNGTSLCSSTPVANLPIECNVPFPDYPGVTAIQPDPLDPRNYTHHIVGAKTSNGQRIIDADDMFMCPGGPKDRAPITKLTHIPVSDFYTTAEYSGMLMPACGMFDLEDNPVPIYAVIGTITYENGTTETLQLSNQAGLSNTGEQQGYVTNRAGNVLLRIDDLDIVGSLGPTLGGRILICNATKPLGGDTGTPTFNPPDLRLYNMAGTAKDEFGLPINPWVQLMRDGFSTIYQYINDEVANADLVAGIPLPGILKGLSSIPFWSWWYWLAPQDEYKYGTGCGQIGMNPNLFGDGGTADKICQRNRHACIPGFIEGYDWTIQQRWYDSDVQEDFILSNQSQPMKQYIMQNPSMNNGSYERYLRDVLLQSHTPCVTSGRMQDMVNPAVPSTCPQFREMNNRFRHLPPDWVPDVEESGGRCAPPKYYIQGGYLIKDDVTLPSNTEAQVRVRLELVVANGYLLQVDEAVAPGSFVPDFGPTKACMVSQGSDDGRLAFEIKNTGTSSGSYVVDAECGLGVTVSTTVELDNLQPGETRTGAVVLNQQGLILPSQFNSGQVAPTQCMLVLRPLALQQIILSTLNASCVVVSSDIATTAGLSNPPFDYCEQGGACSIAVNNERINTAGGVAFFVVISIILTILILLGLLFSYQFMYGNKLKNVRAENRLRQEKEIAEEMGSDDDEFSELEEKDDAGDEGGPSEDRPLPPSALGAISRLTSSDQPLPPSALNAISRLIE